MAKETYRIIGVIVNRESGEGVGGLRVEAWDYDQFIDDLVGRAVTGPDGVFQIAFDSDYFQELFLDKEPDLYFRVYLGQRQVASTEDDILWNVSAGDKHIVIEVDEAATPSPDQPPPRPKPAPPELISGTAGWNPNERLKVEMSQNPIPAGTVADMGLAVSVVGPDNFALTVLKIPFTTENVVGFDATTTRVFRWNEATGTLQPHWNSGINTGLGFLWAKIERPGLYVPLALPRDRLLQDALRWLAREHRLQGTDTPGDGDSLAGRALRLFVEAPQEAVAELRAELTKLEINTGYDNVAPYELRFGQGRHLEPFPLPRDLSPAEFRELLGRLSVPTGGLPEEKLFFPPDIPRGDGPPWPLPPTQPRWPGLDEKVIENLKIRKYIDLPGFELFYPWFENRNWWMYQHDKEHTGKASGTSNITSTTVGSMIRHKTVGVDGPVYTKPAIVDGKIYVGTMTFYGSAVIKFYKIDLATGNIDHSFTPTTQHSMYNVLGVGGSPAVVGDKVYFTTNYGHVYCLRTSNLSQVWKTNLKSPSQAKNQPITNYEGDTWSGPVVANGKVYVGSGEGESPHPFGFIWCLDSGDGKVKWIFCTNKFVDPNNPGNENAPNVLPASAVPGGLPAWATTYGYSTHADPQFKGSAVWSSCAYDSGLNRIYVCTGNSRPDDPLPDHHYASGIIALSAGNGQFKGFFQPSVDDNYQPGDMDVDVPGAPTLFTRGSRRVVGFGSKGGSYFLLDADTMKVFGGWVFELIVTGKLTVVQPQLFTFQDSLHLLFRDEESHAIWHAISEDGKWREAVQIPDQLTKAAPAVVKIQGQLHMVHLGDESNRIWHSVYDGESWSPNVAIPDQLSKAPPALAVYNDSLHMVHLGDESNRLWHSVYNGESWSPNVAIPDQLSKASPALAAYDGRLHLVHLGDESNKIWYSTFDRDAWSLNVAIPDQLSKAPPALCVFQDLLHMVHLGDESNSLWHAIFNGRAWGENETIGEVTSKTAPALAEFGDELHLAIVNGQNSPIYTIVFVGVSQRRQLIARIDGSGHPHDRGTAINEIVPAGVKENKWGVMGTAAVHFGLKRLFVAMGGYSGIMNTKSGVTIRTPFVRALHWNTLYDAWPTNPNDGPGEDKVRRYTTAAPPIYSSFESGLSSPAVVNDVVFVSTDKTAMYAFDAQTGVCLWPAPDLPTGQFSLGPAIYGDYVVVGAGPNVYIYKLPGPRLVFETPIEVVPWWELIDPRPWTGRLLLPPLLNNEEG